jgi:hypothetical protein
VGFGAIIAVKQGPSYVFLDDDLESALTEIRVEQHLNAPTTFGLRFQEDFDDDKARVAEHPLFNQSTELAILVPDGPDSKRFVCLVRGTITQVSFDVDIGAVGSAVEVRGQDVRVLLNRQSAPQTFPGRTSESIIDELAKGIPEVKTCIALGKELYDSKSGGPAAFNCNGTAIDIIEHLAVLNNHCVWLTYETSVGLSVSVETIFNVRSSPDRGEVLNGCPLPPATTFAPRPDIHLLVSYEIRANVVTFKIESDNERIQEVYASPIDDSGVDDPKVSSKTADSKQNGAGVDNVGSAAAAGGQNSKRSSYVGGAGSPTLAAAKAEAMATEASWFVRAEAMTSATLYGAVLEPHQKVKVTGVGCGWTGEYQVRDVIHVINGAEHWMTATLRGNSRGKEETL